MWMNLCNKIKNKDLKILNQILLKSAFIKNQILIKNPQKIFNNYPSMNNKFKIKILLKINN